MNIQNTIKRLRISRDWYQKDMAEKLNIETETYRKIENGQTALTTDRLQQIADIFGIKPMDFYKDSESLAINQSLCTNNEEVNNVINLNKDSEKMLDMLSKLVEDQQKTINALVEQNQVLLKLLNSKA